MTEKIKTYKFKRQTKCETFTEETLLQIMKTLVNLLNSQKEFHSLENNFYKRLVLREMARIQFKESQLSKKNQLKTKDNNKN